MNDEVLQLNIFSLSGFDLWRGCKVYSKFIHLAFGAHIPYSAAVYLSAMALYSLIYTQKAEAVAVQSCTWLKKSFFCVLTQSIFFKVNQAEFWLLEHEELFSKISLWECGPNYGNLSINCSFHTRKPSQSQQQQPAGTVVIVKSDKCWDHLVFVWVNLNWYSTRLDIQGLLRGNMDIWTICVHASSMDMCECDGRMGQRSSRVCSLGLVLRAACGIINV